MYCKEKYATEKVINRLRQEFIKDLSKRGIEKAVDELRHGMTIGLRFPKKVLEPQTIEDLKEAMDILECRYVISNLARKKYECYEHYTGGWNDGDDFYVMTYGDNGYSWIIEVQEGNDMCYLKYQRREEIEKYDRTFVAPLSILAIELGIDVSYFKDFFNSVI